MFKVNNKDNRTTPEFEQVNAGWVSMPQGCFKLFLNNPIQKILKTFLLKVNI